MLWLRYVLAALCCAIAHADFNCSIAPDRDMKTTCKMIQEWDRNARKAIKKRQAFESQIGAPGVPNEPNFTPAVPPRFSPSAQGCMNIQCICPYMGGQYNGACFLPNGQQYLMAYRKEYRVMTDNERNRWHNALIHLKRSGEYDRISVMHRQVGSASGAHSGPGFLPWHREYMKRLEIAVRMIDPGIAMPYWDSVMDSYLPDPRDSIIFSPMFMGETDGAGQVIRGSFAGFRTLEGRPNIVRRLATEGKLFSEANINSLLSQTEIQNVLAYTAPQSGCPFRPNFGALEYTHSSVHLWIGGDMKPPSTSANDPIFFLHHCFVDLIWEMWRQNRQNRWSREQQYPPDIGTCANSQHFSYAQMRPWDKQNKDGLSNEYTDYLYRYAPRPTCSFQNPNCGSPYLFCDTRGSPHCVAKIKQNGLCRGFEGFDACWHGSCQAGWCRPGQEPQQQQNFFTTQAPTTRVTMAQTQFITATQPTMPVQQFTTTRQRTRAQSITTRPTPPPPTMPSTPRFNPILAAVSNSNCYNDDPCCDAWARTGECQMNPMYMSRYCKRSCRLCNNPSDAQRGCHDRHVSCMFWRSQNYCSRRRQWMAENCQASCGWCAISQQQLCASVARMSRL